MNFLFTPNHLQLLNSVYPSSSALLTAGPDYNPNAQELSRLTYYASVSFLMLTYCFMLFPAQIILQS